ALLILLLAGAAVAFFQLQSLLESAHIQDLAYKIKSISPRTVSLSSLQFTQDKLQVAAKDVSLVFTSSDLLSGNFDVLSVAELRIQELGPSTDIEDKVIDIYTPLKSFIDAGLPKIPIKHIHVARLCTSLLSDCVAVEFEQANKTSLVAILNQTKLEFDITDGPKLDIAAKWYLAEELLSQTSQVIATKPDSVQAEGSFSFSQAASQLLLGDSVQMSEATAEFNTKLLITATNNTLRIAGSEPLSLSILGEPKPIYQGSVNIDSFELVLNRNSVIEAKSQLSMSPLTSKASRLQFTNGTLKSETQFSLSEMLPHTLKHTLESVSGNWDEYFFNDLNTVLEMQLQPGLSFHGLKNVTAAEFNPFIPFKSVSFQLAKLQATPHFVFNTKTAKAMVLGGRIALKELQYDSASSGHRFVIELQHLDLERLLELYPQEAVEGTGKFSGHLELRLKQGKLTILNSKLSADKPGGELKYTQGIGSGDNPQLDLVNKALQHYLYTSCEIVPELQANGDLILQVALQGRSPALNKERAVNVNLNVTENLPKLLESFRLVRELPQAIEKGIQ
ncbi:MAG: YdbH domain-containing protein, partial [Bdellovibrionales bacterium]|nr:YdbH domain-containing protein [Bdellovibrionales bacterium]